ncbi:MAG: beta-propeller fold lactonase family protein [Polyangiales bacterium]
MSTLTVGPRKREPGHTHGRSLSLARARATFRRMRKIALLALSLLASSSGCGSSDASTDLSGANAARDGGTRFRDAAAEPLDARVVRPGDASTSDAQLPPVPTASHVYVGGWDWGSGAAYRARSFALDHESALFTELRPTTDLGFNPSHLTPSLDGTVLYASNELPGANAGLTAARIAPDTGALTALGSVPNADGAFVFARVHPSGKYLFAADYYAGALVVYRLARDGTIGAVADRVVFPRKDDDESAQTHGVGIHDDGRYVYVPNKALDTIAQLSFDAERGMLTRGEDLPSEGGPRAIALYGNVAYVMHERDSQLASFRIGDDGMLTPVDRSATLPDDFAGESTGAHVAVHPSGTFVYASNRGHDSIAVFATTAEGMLTRVALTPSEGATPRAFEIDANGALLVVANQGSDGADDGSLVAFAIGSDGLLTRRGRAATGLKSPTTLVLVPRVDAR